MPLHPLVSLNMKRNHALGAFALSVALIGMCQAGVGATGVGATGVAAARRPAAHPDQPYLVGPAPAPAPVGPPTTGVYTDSKGGVHAWSITSAHALQWEGAPWIPVGLQLTPASFSAAPADAADAGVRDGRTLASLKDAGVSDVLINLTPSAMPDSSDTADAQPGQGSPLQAVITSLEAGGFRYGLDINGLLPGQASGYSFGETYVRGEEGMPGAFTAIAPAGATGALFIARNDKDTVLGMGRALVQDGALVATCPEGTTTAFFVPLRRWGVEDGACDLWDGFPAARDHVLFGLRGIHFGPGLRCFLIPLAGPLAPAGRAAYLYPLSHLFQIEFEAWLRRRYPTLDALRLNWAMPAAALNDYQMASRLIPDAAGRPDAAWDPEKDVVIPMNIGPSAFWSDFEAFRAAAARHDMNLLADSLRRNIADVPVVYEWQRFSAVYGPAGDPVSYDGLAVRPGGAGGLARTREAYAFAQAADVLQPRWFISVGGPPGLSLGQLANLIDLGAKGFFLPRALATSDFQPGTVASTDANPAPASADALALIKSLRLALFNRRPDAGDTVNYADYKPATLWFPWDLQIASAKRFDDGLWWLPTFRQGTALPVGAEYEAYQMDDGGVSRVALWSAIGPRTVHLFLSRTTTLEWPIDRPLGKASHGIYELKVSDEPVVFRGTVGQDIFPAEVLDTAMQQSKQLRGSLLVDGATRQRLEVEEGSAHRMRQGGLVREGYLFLSADLSMQRRILLPYVWIEGENAATSSFTGTAQSSQCSGNAYLYLNNPDDPPADHPYAARWNFSVTFGGDYEMWMAGTAPGQDWASSASWELDGAPLRLVATGPSGPAYGPILHWCPFGPLYLSQGSNGYRPPRGSGQLVPSRHRRNCFQSERRPGSLLPETERHHTAWIQAWKGNPTTGLQRA